MHGVTPACPAGLSLLAQAAGVNQPARRDSASVHGVRGFYQPGRQTQPAGAVHGGRPAGQAETASGSWPARLSQLGGTQPAGAVLRGRPASPAGLSLLARAVESTSRPGVTQPPGAGQRGWISRAGWTQPPCTVSVGSTSLPGGLNLRVRSTEVDQPARRDSAWRRGPRGSTSWPGGLSLRARCSTSLPRGTEPPGAGRVG